jgi:hypothetical protein
VAAPGISIPVVSAFGAGTSLSGGTSFAAPIAAGVASLALAVRPDLTPDQLRDVLRFGAVDQLGRPGEDTPGFDVYHGHGRVSAPRSLKIAAGTHWPSIDAPAQVPAVEGVPVVFEVSVSDPDGDPTATLDADLSALPATATFQADADHARGRLEWTPTYAQSGTYVVTFVATNPFHAAARTEIVVRDVPAPPTLVLPPPVRGEEGVPLTAVVGTRDPDGDPITRLEAGPLPSGASFTLSSDLTSGVLTWTPGHAQAGIYFATFTVESLDPAGPWGTPVVERGTAVLRIDVREGPDQPPVIASPAAVDASEGETLSIEIRVADADGDEIVTLSANPLPAGATFDVEPSMAVGLFRWTPDFHQAGSYTIQLAAASAHRATPVSEPVVTEVGASLNLLVRDTPRVLAARAFPEPEDRVVRLLWSKPAVTLRMEAVAGAFRNGDVDLSTIVLRSGGGGEVAEIRPLSEGKRAAAGDLDRNGVEELPVVFSKEALRRLLSDAPSGRSRVPLYLEGGLLSGETFRAEFEMEVVASGGGLGVSVTPHPPGVTAATFSIRASTGDRARLMLFSVAGRLVREWEVPPMGAAGYREVHFDGRDRDGRPLASGIYIYRLDSGGQSASGRLVLVR